MTKQSTADRELSISRLINAPRELVWKVWTEPEHIKNWWGPNGFTNSISKMEVKPEGAWEFVMHGPDGTDYKNKHIYKEVVKPKKLVLSHESGPKFLMTATFTKQGNKTLVTLHSVFESAEQLQEVIKVFKADEGMKQNVDKLENYLANITKTENSTKMKQTKTIYWIFTGLFGAFMMFSAIPDILQTPDAISFMTKLGYPAYFLPFIGVAKALGVIAILIPGFPRIKEWAYAGLAYDLIGAVYSMFALGGPIVGILPMAIPLVLWIGSYVYYRKKIAAVS